MKGSTQQHPDDLAVDAFAVRMKAKLADARAKGRSGWDDPEQCTVAYLQQQLHEHVAKGDPVDVANFCMMLAHYGASASPGADLSPDCSLCAGRRVITLAADTCQPERQAPVLAAAFGVKARLMRRRGRMDTQAQFGKDAVMLNWTPPEPRPESPFSAACRVLRDAGRSVTPSDIPGLVWVDGNELTMGQVMDRARHL
jgi:hypothetical protein